jgi:hypothetical protein
MGFFGKVKGFFAGGKALRVEIVEIEEPFPVGDECHKGRFTITADQACTVIGTNVRFYAEADDKDDGSVEVDFATESSDEVDDDDVKYPLEMKEGQSKELWFCLTDIDIKKKLKKKGISEKKAKFFIEVEADVKGTPFDPTAKKQVSLM